MAQTILSASFEVRGEGAGFLRDRIQGLSAAEAAAGWPRLGGGLPGLHFLSMTVFTDDDYDPFWVIEANFDGPSGAFWPALEAAIGPELRAMLRYCKEPNDGTGPMFLAVVADGSQTPLAPYLESRAHVPAVFHQGNRGLDRPRIEREAVLFEAAQAALTDRASFIGLDPVAIHARLRAELLPAHPWLDTRPADRIPPAEDAADHWRFRGFVLAVVLGLAFPAILAFLLLPWTLVMAASVLLTLVGVWRLRGDLRRLRGRGAAPPAKLLLLGAIALLLLVATGLAPILVGLVCWIRWLEGRDAPQEAPPIDQKAMAEMAEREDRALVNHMGSIVEIKPGILRTIIVHLGLWGLGLYLRTMPEARAGYLASMRTIHFAHWAIIGNGGRLMFFSNFDGTWESYLDDFIEKAHVGLTLAWTNGVGFPPARFLVLDGATNGRLFKAWARHSMAAADLWFCAYPRLTVEQIERQSAIAAGLARPGLSPKEAETWALRL